jgi:hypothetical protein
MTTIISSINGLCFATAKRLVDLVPLNPEFTEKQLLENLERLVAEKKLRSSTYGKVTFYILPA